MTIRNEVPLLKTSVFTIFLAVFSLEVRAQQGPPIEPCAGAEGYASVLCHTSLLEQEQQKLEQSLDEGKTLQQDQQMENLGFQNKSHSARNKEFTNWKSQNRWFGSNESKTQFAMQYAKQLRRDQPDLIGREFFNAVTARVGDTFGAAKLGKVCQMTMTISAPIGTPRRSPPTASGFDVTRYCIETISKLGQNCLGSETAAVVPIHVVGDAAASPVPASCVHGSGGEHRSELRCQRHPRYRVFSHGLRGRDVRKANSHHAGATYSVLAT